MSDEFFKLEASLNGKVVKMSSYSGKIVLVSNVASLCGLSKKNYDSFADMISLYYKKGFRVLIFPCNQFLNQEPGNMEKIREMVKEYSDKIIVFDKVDVYGKNIHPIFKYLTENSSGFLGGWIKWNFTKFLIGEDGEIKKRWGPNKTVREEDLKDIMEGRQVEEEVEKEVKEKNITVYSSEEEE